MHKRRIRGICETIALFQTFSKLLNASYLNGPSVILVIIVVMIKHPTFYEERVFFVGGASSSSSEGCSMSSGASSSSDSKSMSDIASCSCAWAVELLARLQPELGEKNGSLKYLIAPGHRSSAIATARSSPSGKISKPISRSRSSISSSSPSP